MRRCTGKQNKKKQQENGERATRQESFLLLFLKNRNFATEFKAAKRPHQIRLKHALRDRKSNPAMPFILLLLLQSTQHDRQLPMPQIH
jgi:hypothetical protein